MSITATGFLVGESPTLSDNKLSGVHNAFSPFGVYLFFYYCYCYFYFYISGFNAINFAGFVCVEFDLWGTVSVS
jgi:hypothetical protein